ncbi:MAG TPA: hypothetical protein PLQ81_13650, partial [bacterium]|nr:hypothetical protein [bacterium]
MENQNNDYQKLLSDLSGTNVEKTELNKIESLLNDNANKINEFKTQKANLENDKANILKEAETKAIPQAPVNKYEQNPDYARLNEEKNKITELLNTIPEDNNEINVAKRKDLSGRINKINQRQAKIENDIDLGIIKPSQKQPVAKMETGAESKAEQPEGIEGKIGDTDVTAKDDKTIKSRGIDIVSEERKKGLDRESKEPIRQLYELTFDEYQKLNPEKTQEDFKNYLDSVIIQFINSIRDKKITTERAREILTSAGFTKEDYPQFWQERKEKEPETKKPIQKGRMSNTEIKEIQDKIRKENKNKQTGSFYIRKSGAVVKESKIYNYDSDVDAILGSDFQILETETQSKKQWEQETLSGIKNIDERKKVENLINAINDTEKEISKLERELKKETLLEYLKKNPLKFGETDFLTGEKELIF